MSKTVSFSWSARREGNDGFVREDRPNGEYVEFGPMKPEHVLPFIAGRRKMVEIVAREHGGTKTFSSGLDAIDEAVAADPNMDWSFLDPNKRTTQ